MNLKTTCFLLIFAMLTAGHASAQHYLRIGTGSAYYPIGNLMAGAISQPGKIIATAQASNESPGNVISVLCTLENPTTTSHDKSHGAPIK